jgi:peptidylprolyl isomerase
MIPAAACADATGPDFDPSLGIDLTLMNRTSSGLYYQDLTVGTGAVAADGLLATVRYTGWLTNGDQFDTGDYTFRVNRGQVVSGFDEGVSGLKVGGSRRLVIPPSLGYGDQAVGRIPANAHLVFNVELLAVNP